MSKYNSYDKYTYDMLIVFALHSDLVSLKDLALLLSLIMSTYNNQHIHIYTYILFNYITLLLYRSYRKSINICTY